METITLAVPESQIIEWVRQLSPKAKQAVLRVLIPELDEFESGWQLDFAFYFDSPIGEMFVETALL